MCRAHATVRGLLEAFVGGTDRDRVIVVDMEAGLEHLSRGTARHVSCLLAVMEPYYRSMETARLTCQLGAGLGIARLAVVANKVRDEEDRNAIARYCETHSLPLVGHIPYDTALLEAERSGVAPFDHAAGSPAIVAVEALAALLAGEAPAPLSG
jgi:CO dehydrogenase maturation factor